MKVDEAAALIAPAVRAGEHWADLGAGGGTFTRALRGLVGAAGSVLAVERDAASLRALRELADGDPSVRVLAADLTTVPLPPLDGVLLANALHFVPTAEQGSLLARLASALNASGRLVVVEYDDRPASRWVPYPVSSARLAAIAAGERLGAPAEIGRRASRYGGSMYAAALHAA